MKKIVIDKDEEIILLAKILSYIKFQSTDDASLFLAKSPIINRLSDKVYESIKDIPRNLRSDKLEDHQHIIDNILKKLSLIDNWNEFSDEIKNSTIATLVYPYKAEVETLKQIKEKADIKN